MVKLRHINGSNLPDLERELEKIKLPIVIQNIQKVGSNWFIFFLVQGTHEEKQPTNNVLAAKTSTVKKKKSKSKQG